MHTRRLNRIARYLGSAGFYKEAYQMKKVAQEELEDELDLAQQGLETNNEFEDLFPSSPDIMDEDEEEEDEEGLSEYLDEEGMEPAGEERFDDEGFNPDSFDSLPHDDEDEEEDEDSDLLEDEDEDLSEDDQELYDMMMSDPDRLMKLFPKK